MRFSRREYWSGCHFYAQEHILKSRDITLPTKDRTVKAAVFPVVMYGCERWTIKKAECRRIDAFNLWCWRRLLRVPWIARRSDQSMLKEISPEYSLEGLMLKLKLQYFGHLMQRTNSLEKTLMLGKIEGKRRRGQKRMRWLDSIINSMNMSLKNSGRWWRTQKPGCCSLWGCKELDMTEWLNNNSKDRWPLSLNSQLHRRWLGVPSAGGPSSALMICCLSRGERQQRMTLSRRSHQKSLRTLYKQKTQSCDLCSD